MGKRGNPSSNSPIQSDKMDTSNRYETLNPNEDLSDSESVISSVKKQKTHHDTSKQQTAQVTPKSSPKPPPINVKGADFKSVRQMLDSIAVLKDDCFIRLTPSGVRIFASSTEIHKKIIDHLKSENSKFFTHQLREEQTTKIVLHGLHNMPENELKEALEEVGIKPSGIVKLTVRNLRHSDHCVFLLHFPKSDNVKISKIREVKAVNYVMVRWEYFKNKRNGPIQCSKCMQYGHGAKSCFLDPVCVRCGGGHESKSCNHLTDPVTKQVHEKIPDDLVKCGLCGQNHTANFSGCQKRKEFIDRQNLYRARTQRRNQRQNAQNNFQFQNAPQLKNFTLPGTTQQVNLSPQSNGNNDLFSPDQLMSIFQELMTSMSQARNKMDQINALGKIVIKYTNNGFTT